MHVFRIMDMPDRVIAFEGLPKRFLEGFEMIPAAGFPKHWKEWMGKSKKEIRIPPERDPFTGAVRRFDPIIEEDYFFYSVDQMVNPVMERWRTLCDWVKNAVPAEAKLEKNVADMAKPLAGDKVSQISLEPDEVPLVVIPEEARDKEPKIITAPVAAQTLGATHKCEQCPKEYDKPRALKMHVMAAHKKEPATA